MLWVSVRKRFNKFWLVTFLKKTLFSIILLFNVKIKIAKPRFKPSLIFLVWHKATTFEQPERSEYTTKSNKCKCINQLEKKRKIINALLKCWRDNSFFLFLRIHLVHTLEAKKNLWISKWKFTKLILFKLRA